MSEGIVYQNKDILFKILSQTYKEKSFAAYGIDLPPIRELLPTNLPRIAANEKSIDNLFLLEDGTEIVKIMKATGLTEEELLNLRNELLAV